MEGGGMYCESQVGEGFVLTWERYSSQRGWILRRKKLNILHEEWSRPSRVYKDKSTIRIWVIWGLRENQRARVWQGSGEGGGGPRSPFLPCPYMANSPHRACRVPLADVCRMTMGWQALKMGHTARCLKNNYFSTDLLGICETAFGKLKLCSILQLCWIHHFPNWTMESFHFHF